MCNKQDMIGKFLDQGRPSGPIVTDAGPKIDFNKKLIPLGTELQSYILSYLRLRWKDYMSPEV